MKNRHSIQTQLPYHPGPVAQALLCDVSEELVLSGPAGTGKSRACLEKLHLALEEWPDCRALLVRKTRTSLTETGLVTFEQHVLPLQHAARTPVQRRNRQSYDYPNGSHLVVAGLDNPQRIMSTEYDLIYVQEATELTENDWEMLLTRLRNGKMPYQQLLADCNPDTPTHWLKRRAENGLLQMLESRHEDNPRLWNPQIADWTEVGRAYLQKLDRLTGARHHRLRLGRWVGAEGVVYEGWDRALHLLHRNDPLLNNTTPSASGTGFSSPPASGGRWGDISSGGWGSEVSGSWGEAGNSFPKPPLRRGFSVYDQPIQIPPPGSGNRWDPIHRQPAPPPAPIDPRWADGLADDLLPSWPRFWVVDFGYTQPFVWQAWAQDPDGRLYRYREIYRTQRLVEDHAREILALTAKEPRPQVILCDHDAEDRATLERHLGMGTTPAHKSVSDGIQAVASRLRPAGDGKPRLFLLRDSLISRDEALFEARKPTCTEDEIDGYIWNTTSGRHKGEEPLKANDHGMDAMRYLVAYQDLQFKPWSSSIGLY